MKCTKCEKETRTDLMLCYECDIREKVIFYKDYIEDRFDIDGMWFYDDIIDKFKKSVDGDTIARIIEEEIPLNTKVHALEFDINGEWGGYGALFGSKDITTIKEMRQYIENHYK